ncbi:uncharacterized protein [Coffea arabica]|uniref:Ankyrin repeat-containing protein BDA1-like n=1 Tax=Coffea arabica TaxID=13443 RepID=A0ABM4U6H1_COFAR
MEQILAEAAQSGDINALYDLLRQDPTLLDKYDEPSFVDTPAHIAAAAGSTHFAIEVLSLKPSFSTKLNPDGYSPLDLALRHGKTQTVKRLIKHDPQFIRVKGRERFTPLHYVAEVGDAELLAEFLEACPESTQDLTIRGETAVHIAARNMNVRALQVLLSWVKRNNKERILNWTDENGDTALHIAASRNNFEVVRLLIKKVRINEKNLEGFTCLDTFMGLPNTGDEKIGKILSNAGAKTSSSLRPLHTFAHIRSSKARFTNTFLELSADPDGCFDGLSSEMRNAILMVALVFFAASYQAVLSPPGGISSGGDTILFSNNSSNISSSSNFASKKTTIDTSDAAGEVQMEWEAFWQFYFFNSIMFFTSLLTILKLLPGVFYVRLVYLILSAIYGMSLRIISPESPISTALYLSMCAPYYLLLIIAHNLGAQWRKSRAHIGNYYVTRDHLRL